MWETDKIAELKGNLYRKEKKLSEPSKLFLESLCTPLVSQSTSAVLRMPCLIQFQVWNHNFDPKSCLASELKGYGHQLDELSSSPGVSRSLPSVQSLQGDVQLRNAAFPGSRGRRCWLCAQRDHNLWAVLMKASAQEVFDLPQQQSRLSTVSLLPGAGRIGLLLLLPGDCSDGIWQKAAQSRDPPWDPGVATAGVSAGGKTLPITSTC